MTLRATLVTDGTSDVVLLPVLQWLMRQLTRVDFEIRWADPRAFPENPRSLAARLAVATQEYPCQPSSCIETPRNKTQSLDIRRLQPRTVQGATTFASCR